MISRIVAIFVGILMFTGVVLSAEHDKIKFDIVKAHKHGSTYIFSWSIVKPVRNIPDMSRWQLICTAYNYNKMPVINGPAKIVVNNQYTGTIRMDIKSGDFYYLDCFIGELSTLLGIQFTNVKSHRLTKAIPLAIGAYELTSESLFY